MLSFYTTSGGAWNGTTCKRVVFLVLKMLTYGGILILQSYENVYVKERRAWYVLHD